MKKEDLLDIYVNKLRFKLNTHFRMVWKYLPLYSNRSLFNVFKMFKVIVYLKLSFLFLSYFVHVLITLKCKIYLIIKERGNLQEKLRDLQTKGTLKHTEMS
jgi:hypothetical protein